MARFYLEPKTWTPQHLELSGEEAQHALKVLRLKVGSKISLFDGKGRSAQVEISSILSNTQLYARIISESYHEELTPKLHLCQSIPKGGNMELIIQKAVELGVSVIYPIITERTIVRIKPKESLEKQAKWQRIALEACKQCGQNHLPIVHPPQEFTAFLSTAQLPATRLHAALTPEARPLKSVLTEIKTQEAALLVGPEGDFTQHENQLAAQYGFTPISLGDIILRVETASLYALSVLKYTLS